MNVSKIVFSLFVHCSNSNYVKYSITKQIQFVFFLEKYFSYICVSFISFTVRNQKYLSVPLLSMLAIICK